MRRTIALTLSMLATAVLLSLISGVAAAQVVGSLPSGGTSARQARGEVAADIVPAPVVSSRIGRSTVATFRALPSRSWLAVWKARGVALRRNGFLF